jgi:hypothetical protein
VRDYIIHFFDCTVCLFVIRPLQPVVLMLYQCYCDGEPIQLAHEKMVRAFLSCLLYSN